MAREMKDSGVAWIDRIPIDWQTKNIRALFFFGKGLPITKDNLRDSGISVISYGQIHSKQNPGTHLEAALFRYVDEEYLKGHTSSLVHSGDFIFADTSEDLEGCGNCAYVNANMTLFAGYHTIILRSKDSADNRYFAYLFKSDGWRRQIRERVTGVKLFSVSQKILKDVSLIVPPKDMQRTIANYLDLKCAKIDAILDKTRTSIEEYKKLKQATITQAVTKGVRGDRPMRESGIEWASLIPSEWENVNPKALFSQRKEKAAPGERQLTSSQKYGIVYQDDYMELTGSRVVVVQKDFDILKHVEAGDFIISMRSFQGGLEYSTKTGSISSAYVMLVPNLNLVYPRFYRWLLKSEVYIRALQRTSNMVRDGQAMRYSNFAQVRLYTVPLQEQMEIADYLDEKCAMLDALIEKKEKFISEIESYKKSLIYEHVTGKKEAPQA